MLHTHADEVLSDGDHHDPDDDDDDDDDYDYERSKIETRFTNKFAPKENF